MWADDIFTGKNIERRGVYGKRNGLNCPHSYILWTSRKGERMYIKMIKSYTFIYCTGIFFFFF